MPLPDAEFFMLRDEREDHERLSCDYDYDVNPDQDLIEERDEYRLLGLDDAPYVKLENEPMPGQYDADPDRSRALAMERFQLIRDLYPERPATQPIPKLFADHRVGLEAKYLIGAAYFRGDKPANLTHYETLRDYAGEPTQGEGGYLYWPMHAHYLVSADWKAAIEHVEPGVHQFFPYDLHFQDGDAVGYFAFRDMQFIDFIHPSIPLQGFTAEPTALMGLRAAVQGLHWAKRRRGGSPFVSRALAESLFPLLPRKTTLIPIRLI